MMLYNIIASVQWWCIFILYTQRTDCASFFSNAESTGIGGVTLPSLCSDSDPSEQYVSDKGAGSSLVLSLRPEHGRSSSASSCKRQFRAPDAYNFFVRLQRIPGASGTRGASSSRKYSSSTKSGNTTNSCALTISQSANGEVLPSWRLDPCALESAATAAATTPEDQMRLLQGKLNIVWKHDGNAPNYRLHITVVGQGNVCLEREKHSCLAYAGMPLLCIASELICDGVPNCPPLGSDVSDENEEMCAKHRQEVLSENPVQSVFRKYIQNTLKSFFGGEPDDLSSDGLVSSDAELSLRFPPAPSTPAPVSSSTATETATATAPAKKHRSSLTGLSKYGPWGYLFLGMLICGGALLICGLWECCCRSHKREQSPDDSLATTVVPSFLQTSSPGDVSGAGANGGGPAVPSLNLPHYAELDPPPAYSVLFPNQKPSDDAASGTTTTPDDGDEGTIPVTASAPSSQTAPNDAIAVTNVTGGLQGTALAAAASAGTAAAAASAGTVEGAPALEVASPQQPITLLPAHSSSSSPA
uniref:E3 ubiquitin-protein ligase trim33 n=1 Tax=Anopheles marajoara TaxID=58244 RepID=A0A2M4BK04_9DIPT